MSYNCFDGKKLNILESCEILKKKSISRRFFNLIFDPSSDVDSFKPGDVQTHFINLKIFSQITMFLKCSFSKKQQYQRGEDSNLKPLDHDQKAVTIANRSKIVQQSLKGGIFFYILFDHLILLVEI